MKTLKSLLLCALALVAMACSNEETKDDAYYASNASISSNDSAFTAANGGGSITFKAAGGQVVVYVNCGTDWTAANDGSDWLGAAVDTETGAVTFTAEQNTVESQRTATVTLKTAAKGVVFATLNVSQNAYGAPTVTLGASEWNAPAVGALSTSISVDASDEWEAACTAEWLTVETTDTALNLTAQENESTESRSTEVSITCNDGIKTTTVSLDVIQDGKAYITLSQETIELESDEGSATVTVESNFDWECSYDTANDWLKVSGSGSTLTVSVSENEGDAREETVTVKASDGAENSAEAQLTVSQKSAQSPLILTYTVSDRTDVELPLAGTVDCTIDWGDGTVTTARDSIPAHSYVNAGEYDVTVTGTVTALNSATISDYSTLTGIKQWGKTGLTRMRGAFYNCSNLKALPEDTEGSFSEVTNFDMAFSMAGIVEVPAGLFAYGNKITTMQMTFYFCSSLTTVAVSLFENCPNISNFNSTFGADMSWVGESPYDMIDGKKVHLYERMNDENKSHYGVTEINSSMCFIMCNGLTDYNDIPSSWLF